MISLSPSTSRWSSSGETRPSFLPRRRVDNVRIWLIFTQAGFPTFTDSSSKTRGNPARWGWLVNAMAMTVPECSLNTSALRTTTGRRPACSWPTTGFRLAQTMSPLRTRAIRRGPRSTLRRPSSARPTCSAWRTRERVELVTDGFLDGAAPVRELALRDEAVDALQELFFDGDGDLGGWHGECSL